MAAPQFADYIVERRLLRRRLSFWRIAAFAAVALAVLVLGFRLFGGEAALKFSPHIARVSISGVITGDRNTLNLISKLEDSQASAVLISIDSPGGTTTGAERLYEAIRRLSVKKPTVAVVGTLAASGGYIAALGADQIVAQGNSLIGSIGVLVQYPNFTKLLDMVGVKVEDVKSSPLKAAPNGFEPTTPEARAALASIVNDSFDWFKDLVKQRRAMTDPQLAAVDDGRVFTGRQGIGLHLVDRLGGDREAIAWLEQEKAVPKGLKIRDWKPSGATGRFGLFSLVARGATFFRLDGLSQMLAQAENYAEASAFEGLVSIWQVDGAN
jgi:protease-4